MGRFNDLSDDEKARLIRGPYGTELLKSIQACAAPLHWDDKSLSTIPSNGSAFFVRTPVALFAVTARHVFDEFNEQADEGGSSVCRLRGLTLDLRSRLISRGRQSDLATFEIGSSELDGLGMNTVPWPAVIPSEGQSVVIAGFPGSGKRLSHFGQVLTFGMYLSATIVTSCNDQDLSMVRPPDNEVADVLGKGLPPRGFDMSGMSGGPVVALLESPAGIVSWALAGVIYECGTSFEITKAVRADRIDERGTIVE